MVKIETEIKGDKEMEAQKREKPNKEFKEIIIERENMVSNF